MQVGERAKLVALGLAIRLALAPFFMHVWDVTTIFTATDQFLHGINPYEYVVERAQQLLTRTGIPIPYYGYAYLPTPLLIYAPFYAAYTAIYPSQPIVGGHGSIYTGLELAYPGIFLALLLIKIPVILADAGTIYILAGRSRRAAKIYALSPYSIVITSIWGNFDPLIGFLLLASYVTFDKDKVVSGFLYGLSAMKIYTVVALGAYIAHTYRRPKEMAMFIAGAAISLIPTAYYLAVDPRSFIHAVLFQAGRPVNGLNIYYSLIEIRSLQQVTQLTHMVSVVFAFAIIAVTILMARRGLSLPEFITAMMLTYIVFAPVTNEQLLAALLPIGLLSRNFTHKLTAFPLAYIAFNSTYHYFAIPMAYATPWMRRGWDALDRAWGWMVKDVQLQARYSIGVAMGLSSFYLLTRTPNPRMRVRVVIGRGSASRDDPDGGR